MQEVASFVQPVDQFEAGETAFACVAFSAALVFYSTAPGTSNNYNAEQIDQLADTWYGKEEGSFDASNTNGMDVPALHAMLNGMNLTWKDLGVSATSQHDSDIAAVKAALNQGFPVLVCGAETGFKYASSEAVPYTWQPTGNHCIVATKVMDSGNLGVRDMAALANGNQPGTLQEYDDAAMFLISATAIVPHWLSIPPPPPPPPLLPIRVAFEAEWTSLVATANPNTGIAKASWADYQLGKFHGPPLKTQVGDALGEEDGKTWGGAAIKVMRLAGGRYEWLLPNGPAKFYPYQ